METHTCSKPPNHLLWSPWGSETPGGPQSISQLWGAQGHGATVTEPPSRSHRHTVQSPATSRSLQG